MAELVCRWLVVYRSIPTSNRNNTCKRCKTCQLYIVLFLHQTATRGTPDFTDSTLYIVLFLHQTATVLRQSCIRASCISFYSYIKPQPHPVIRYRNYGCISFYSYIKPQLFLNLHPVASVVYRSIPTSNRNARVFWRYIASLYIVLFLHQTATLFSKLPLNKEIQGHWRDKKTEV